MQSIIILKGKYRTDRSYGTCGASIQIKRRAGDSCGLFGSEKDIRSNEKIAKHADWADTFCKKYDGITEENVMDILKKEVGEVFVHVLEDAGVYKCTEEGREAFLRFVKTL